MKGVWGFTPKTCASASGGLGETGFPPRGFGGLPPKRAPARPGVWGFTPKTCASASGGLGVYPQNVRKHVPGVLRGLAPLRRSQGGASSQSPFMFGAVGRLPPLTSLPCSSFSAKRHAKVACLVVNALTTALFCYHLFAVCVLSHAFLWACAHK